MVLTIDGRCLTPEQFREHVDQLNWDSWRPSEVILHHTWKPTVESWQGAFTIEAMRRVYEERGWVSGPHVFVAQDGIWLFTPLTEPGTHVSGRNHCSIGIEMIGDYDEVRPSGTILSYTLIVLRTLLDTLGLDSVAFHRDYADKSCPGWAVTHDWVEGLLQEVRVSKTGLSFQTMPEWAHGMTVPAGFPILIINPPEVNPFPGAFIIGRAWIGGDTVEQAMIDKGAAGGREYFERCKEFYDRAPYVDVWLGPNEPKPWWDKLQFLDEFNGTWIPSMHDYGKQTGAGVFSVGEPQLDYLQTLRKTCALTDYLVTHQYGNPSMQYEAEWLSLRHRKVVQKLRELNYRVPPILITECGIDGGAVLEKDGDKYNRPGQGWVTVIGDKVEFLSQMEWWDDELCKDPDVRYAVTFISGPNGDWVSFIWDEQMAQWSTARYRDNSVDNTPDISEDIIREAAWNAVGIRFNMNAALTREAQARGLGAPQSDEDYDRVPGYVVQGFVGAILSCPVGDWGNITETEW